MAETGLGERMITATLNIGRLRKERKDSPLYYIRTLKERRRALREVRSFCYFKNRRPEIYNEVTESM